jgi:hypothetical protein
VEVADVLVGFKQSRQAALEHSFSLILIELIERKRLREFETGFLVGCAHELDGVFLADTGPGAGAVENESSLCPELTEKTCLHFSEFG